MTDFETILVETRGRVGWITLNRPDNLNALNAQTMHDVVVAAESFDRDAEIGAIVVTGAGRAFAAGADIKEMEDRTGLEMRLGNYFGEWARFVAVRKPVIAAVNGFALGGGCELAMMSDIILASDAAKFGQPEINLGVVPGMGGSQRLARAIGAYKAAELVLTGRLIDAAEADRAGLVSRVVSADTLLDEAQQMGEVIASKSLPSVIAAKELIRTALETPLAEGLRHEAALFTSLFDTQDQKEGMSAFREKRQPNFENR